MQAILWPHMFEDLEYLLEPEDVEMYDGTVHQPQAEATPENAVAGPSRLAR